MRAAVPGIAAAALLAFFSFLLVPGQATAVAILAGLLLSRWVPDALRPGLQWCNRHVLWVAVALLGAAVPLQQARDVGSDALVLAATAITVALLAAWLLGRLFGVRPSLAWALGVGTGICGASAIAAARRSIGASDEDTAYGVGAVTVLGTVGLGAAALATSLHLPADIAGAWAGASLHAVPHAIAAGDILGGDAGAAMAGAVKMTRVAMLPVLLLVLGGRSRIPGEVVAFVAMLFIAAKLTAPALRVVHVVDEAAFLVAFAALGLSLPRGALPAGGHAPLWVGLGTWLAVLAATGGVLVWLW